MSPYEDMDAVQLRHELDEWTQKTLDWADDLANAIDARDMIRAAFILHAYKQSRHQMRRIRHVMQIGVA